MLKVHSLFKKKKKICNFDKVLVFSFNCSQFHMLNYITYFDLKRFFDILLAFMFKNTHVHSYSYFFIRTITNNIMIYYMIPTVLCVKVASVPLCGVFHLTYRVCTISTITNVLL